MKINFTQEHFARMQTLLMAMLLGNKTVQNRLGQSLNVAELLHTTSISSLNGMRLALDKQIHDLEDADEWVATEYTQKKLDDLKASRELVNLIIGYKRHHLELEENKNKKAALVEKIAQMKEEAKTPEERLKEAEAELASLEENS